MIKHSGSPVHDPFYSSIPDSPRTIVRVDRGVEVTYKVIHYAITGKPHRRAAKLRQYNNGQYMFWHIHTNGTVDYSGEKV